MKKIITVTNQSGETQKSFKISFSPTRTVFQSLVPVGNHAGTWTHLDDEHSFEVSVPNAGLLPEEEMKFELDYIGEPVSEPTVEFKGRIPNHLLLGQEQLRFTQQLPFSARDFSGTFASRVAATMSEHRSDFRRASVFFAEYDNQTYPPLLRINEKIPKEERNYRLFVIIKAADIMRQRVLLRGKAAKLNTLPDSDELLRLRFVDQNKRVNEALTKEEVAYLSSVQRPIFERNHGAPTSVDSVGEAFELFANGEIRYIGGVSNAEPDSAYEFSFAEFAFTCVQFDVEVDFWGPLIAPIARSQRIFSTVYAPGDFSEKTTYGAYLAANFDSSRQVTDSFKEALRKEYSGLSIEDLALKVGHNALAAFPGEYTAKEPVA